MKAPYPFEIFQRDNRVDLLHEYQHIVRRIWTDGRQHPKGLDSTWMGHSIGRYEGETLVVDTVGLNSRTWLDPAAIPTVISCTSLNASAASGRRDST